MDRIQSIHLEVANFLYSSHILVLLNQKNLKHSKNLYRADQLISETVSPERVFKRQVQVLQIHKRIKIRYIHISYYQMLQKLTMEVVIIENQIIL